MSSRFITRTSTLRGISNKAHPYHYLHTVWAGMMTRCYNPKSTAYANYGGRGIRVDLKWHNSQQFIQHILQSIGPKPSSRHSLDRYPDNDGDYKPGNVRWGSPKEQCRNKSTNRLISAFGTTLTLAEWVEWLNMDYSYVWLLLEQGHSMDWLILRIFDKHTPFEITGTEFATSFHEIDMDEEEQSLYYFLNKAGAANL